MDLTVSDLGLPGTIPGTEQVSDGNTDTTELAVVDSMEGEPVVGASEVGEAVVRRLVGEVVGEDVTIPVANMDTGPYVVGSAEVGDREGANVVGD